MLRAFVCDKVASTKHICYMVGCTFLPSPLLSTLSLSLLSLSLSPSHIYCLTFCLFILKSFNVELVLSPITYYILSCILNLEAFIVFECGMNFLNNLDYVINSIIRELWIWTLKYILLPSHLDIICGSMFAIL